MALQGVELENFFVALVLLGVPAGLYDGPLTYQFEAVEGPGHFFLWQADTGGLSVQVDTSDGIDASDNVALAAGGHSHHNWGFTAPGEQASWGATASGSAVCCERMAGDTRISVMGWRACARQSAVRCACARPSSVSTGSGWLIPSMLHCG